MLFAAGEGLHMAKLTTVKMVLLALVLAGAANAVPPESVDQFGNPEEPALRPLKWTLLGVQSLVSTTHAGVKKGAYENPAAMAGEGVKGAAAGTGSLATHLKNGVLFAPLPPKKEGNDLSYEQAAMLHIEKQTAKECPAEAGCCGAKEEACATEEEPNAQFRQPAPSTAFPTLESAVADKRLTVGESDVQKAQRRYVPLQAGYRGKNREAGDGNLLKLAK